MIGTETQTITLSLEAFELLKKATPEAHTFSSTVIDMFDLHAKLVSTELSPEVLEKQQAQEAEYREVRSQQISKLRELRAFLQGLQNGAAIQISDYYMEALDEVVS